MFVSVRSRETHTSTWLDVDECAKDNGGCHEERKCTNTAGGRTCGDCSAGWDNDGATGCKGWCHVLDDAIVVQRAI